MKRIIRDRYVAPILITCGLLSSGLAAPAAEAAKWKVTGELEEACSCRPPCPCWFKSLPSRMTCDGAQVIFISKGRYGKTRLDGLALAQFVQSPKGKTMFESFGDWNFDYVYIDETADASQREALKEIAAHLFPMAAKKREIRSVPITRKIDGAEHTITVGTYGSFSGKLVEGGFGATPKIVNPPLADPTHKEFLQGKTIKMTYQDAGQGWDYENSNYMWNKFAVDHKAYAKFEANMAKKMAELKTNKEN